MTGKNIPTKFTASLLLCSITFFAGLVTAHAQDARLIEAAQKEGSVIGYTSLDNDIAKAQMDLSIACGAGFAATFRRIVVPLWEGEL